MPDFDMSKDGPAKAASYLEKRVRTLTDNSVSPYIDATAVILQTAIVEQLSKPGTGRKYKRGKRRWHTASAPGQPPAVDRGRLRRSINFGRVNGKMRVGTGVAYAPMLEYGTVHILPRPFMRPALAVAKGRMNGMKVSVSGLGGFSRG